MNISKILRRLIAHFFATAPLVSWCGCALADELSPATDRIGLHGGGTAIPTTPTHPVSGASAVQTLAKESHENGVRLYDLGKLEESLAAFERAYALAPHYAVLFNIGQLQSKLGQPVEAVRALGRFLEEGATRISHVRRQEAERVLALNERLIGRLRIEVKPRDATVQVDGVEWSSNGAELPLAQGHHVVVASRDGFLQKTETLRIRGMSQVSLRLTLEPNVQSKPEAIASPIDSWLSTTCSASNASIQIDDWAPISIEGRTALIGVQSGIRRLRFERAGYAAAVFTTPVERGRTVTVDCRLKLPRIVAAKHRALLKLDATSSEVQVIVDDQPFVGEDIVTGPHRVKLVRGTQVVWQKDVDVSAGQVLAIPGQDLPVLLPERAQFSQKQAVQRERLAYAVAGTGAAFLAGSITAFVVGAHRYDEWRVERDRLASGDAPSTLWSRTAERAAAVQRAEDLGIGLGVAAVALLGTSIYLWATAKSLTPPQHAVACQHALSWSW